MLGHDMMFATVAPQQVFRDLAIQGGGRDGPASHPFPFQWLDDVANHLHHHGTAG